MSEEEKKESAPKQNSGDSTAETYIEEQLVKTRKGLHVTRIVMVALAVVMFLYLSWLKSVMKDFYEPKGAAETALGFITPQIDNYTEQGLAQIDTRIPGILESIPEKILEALPEYRNKLRIKIVESIEKFAQETSTDLGETLDGVLAAHGDQIADLLKTADDPHSADALAQEIVNEITLMLDKKEPGGESIQDKLNFSLTALEGIERHVERLANDDKSLTEHEKKQRRVIAILVRTIDQELANTALYLNREN